MLSIEDHRRDSAGLLYVYPVVSRRAGGVSVGINLNVNNACNWACVYCQVENLSRGGPPPVDLDRLGRELSDFLDAALHGDFMENHVAPESRQLVDIAFSGNGEPTSAAEFAAAVDRVACVLERFELAGKLPVRLITNGSLLHRPGVQSGICRLAAMGGEVWFKIDRTHPADVAAVNGVAADRQKVLRNLERCAALAPTWVQTCWFEIDGEPPSAAALADYCALLLAFAGRLEGVHLYGLARPSMQLGAAHLGRMTAAALNAVGETIKNKTGIRVLVSP